MTLTHAFVLGLVVGLPIAFVLLSFFVVSGRSEDCLNCVHCPKEEEIMKCGKCGGLTERQHDRVKCLICGRSRWREFEMRRPGKAEMKTEKTGRPSGSGNMGRDNIKAQI